MYFCSVYRLERGSPYFFSKKLRVEIFSCFTQKKNRPGKFHSWLLKNDDWKRICFFSSEEMARLKKIGNPPSCETSGVSTLKPKFLVNSWHI